MCICAGVTPHLATSPSDPPTLLEDPWPHCIALWRQSQQLKLHHGPHVHLSFLQGGVIIVLPQTWGGRGVGGGRRHCVCTCMDLEKNQVPLPMPFLSSLTPSSCLGLKKILMIIYSAIHSTCTKECPEIIYIHTYYIELCIVKAIHRAHRPSGNAYVLIIM